MALVKRIWGLFGAFRRVSTGLELGAQRRSLGTPGEAILSPQTAHFESPESSFWVRILVQLRWNPSSTRASTLLSTQPNILGTEYLVFLVLFVCFHGSGARCPTALIWDAGGEHVESAESSFLVGYEVYFSCGGIGAQAEILILAEHATESYSPSTQRRSRPLVPRKSSAPVKKLTELPLHLSQVGSFL